MLMPIGLSSMPIGLQVERAKAAVDKVADRNSYLEVCTALRQQQDKEVELSQQLQVRPGLSTWVASGHTQHQEP